MHNRFGLALAASIGLSVTLGCSPAVKAPARSAAPPTPSNVTLQATLPAEPPDVPTLVQATGKAISSELPSADATVLARLETTQATYLLLRGHHDQELVGAVLDSVLDPQASPLVAAVTGTGTVSQSLNSPEYELILRIPGHPPRALPTVLQWTSRGSRVAGHWRGGYRQTLKLSGLDSASVHKDLELRFAEAMAHWFEVSAHGESFAAFAAARLRHKFATSSDVRSQLISQNEQGRLALAELMDFYTARSAISDSLQTERGLQVGTTRQRMTEPLSTLELQDSAESMRGADRSTTNMPCPMCSAVSDFIPAESLVVEFATLKDLVQLPHLLDARLGPLLRVAEAAGGSSHLIERYRQQLAIELDGFAETVGQFAVKTVAVVLSDPYLREGTDLTLVFQAENPALLQGVLESHLQRAKLKHSDLRSVQEQLGGQTVIASTTADGGVRRFEYAFDDYRVVSNSRAALTRVIRVRQGLSPRLSQDRDYVAARSSEPMDPKRERALLFFGNGFVASVVGPRSKILESRRVRAKAELQAVDSAALLFGWMEGRRPADSSELLRSGWLERADLTHFDGSVISWSPNRGAHSTWGYAQSLTPIVDLQLTKVSKDEASAYRNFQRRYEAEMRGVLDPTALRFERTSDDKSLAASLSVYPIPIGGKFNAEFRRGAELVGGGRIVPADISRGASVTFGIGDDSPLRRLADTSILELLAHRELTANFIGDWAMAGLGEGSAVWDMAGQKDLIARRASPDQSKHLDVDDLLSKSPLWIAVHVRSKLLLTASIAALHAKLDRLDPDLVKWHKDAAYRGVPITRVRVAGQSAGSKYVDVFYAIANDVLLVSLRRNLLLTRVDDVLAGHTPKRGSLPEDSAQWVLDLAPQPLGWLQQTAQAVLDQAAVAAHEHACAGLQLLSRGYGALPNDPKEQRMLALRLLGYEPEAPQGDKLQWQNGQCEGGYYGSILEPNVPDIRNPDLLLHQLLSKIGAVRITLGTVQKRDALELRARFELNHGPSHPSQ